MARLQLGPVQAEQYVELVARKIRYYTTIAPPRLGAIIGSDGTADLLALSRFGFFLGVLFKSVTTY